MKEHYTTIRDYWRSRRRWCSITALSIVLVLVVVNIKIGTEDSFVRFAQYVQYTAQTSEAYGNGFLFIFCENLKSAVFLILTGTIPLGAGILFSVCSLCVGLSAIAKWLLTMIEGWQLLLCCIPHGIFEIPAIIFSIMMAVLWSSAITLAVFGVCTGQPVWQELKKEGILLFKSAVFVLLPLILLGAVAEATLTKWVVELVLG